MEKKHLGYSDRLLMKVVKSQEADLKNQKPLVKPDGKDEEAMSAYEAEKEQRGIALQFYKECLGEAEKRGLVKVPEQKKEEPKKEEPKKDAGQ